MSLANLIAASHADCKLLRIARFWELLPNHLIPCVLTRILPLGQVTRCIDPYDATQFNECLSAILDISRAKSEEK